MPNLSKNILLRFALFASFAPIFVGCDGSPKDAETAPKETPPIKVQTVVAPRDVETELKFMGRTVSVRQVEIVSRVQGFIESVDFEDGALVEVGQPLFHIQAFDYENAVQKAENDLALARANEATARTAYEVDVQSNERTPGSVAEFDIIREKNEWEVAKAQVKINETLLEFQKKRLEYAVVKSPIRGKVSAAAFTEGAFLAGNGGEVLCVVNEVDPTCVSFSIPDSLLSDLTTRFQTERESGEKLYVPFEARLATGSSDDVFTGVLDYIDTTLDVSTGNMRVRGKIDAADYRLFPGYICEIRVKDETLTDAIVVDAENKVSRRYIETEKVISDGAERIIKPRKESEVVEIDGEKSRVETGL